MKQRSAPGPHSAARKSTASQSVKGRVKKFGKQVLDRVFLRSTIWEIRKEVRAVPDLERSLDESVILLSKKIDYLLAKIDAYAEVDDRNYAALREDLKLEAKRPEPHQPAPIEPAAEGEATALIEVLGPSGVGKSTILRAAQALRSPQEMWWGPDEIDATIAAAGTGASKLREAFDNFSPHDFIPRCLEIVGSSRMLPSQKVSAAFQLRGTCHAALAARNVSARHPLVHDELLLHRASTLLLYSETFEDHAAWYFDTVPVPDIAVVIRADVDTIVRRIRGRQGKQVSTYHNLGEEALREIVGRSLRLTEIATERLRRRGVAVTEIAAGEDVAESAGRLHAFISERYANTAKPRAGAAEMTDYEKQLKERLRAASQTFRKKDGRHTLKTEDVIYCAFDTGRFGVARDEAQRSAPERLARFGIGRTEVQGKTVLDLGCHAGAMLLQLSNLEPESGLGIEYDADKVALAREIAAYSGLTKLRFEQGDLDRLDPEALGTFDIVFALAIEGHVLDPERLYALLGRVTGDLLCFEGNGGCDVEEVKDRLLANGFTSIHYIGFCDDDIRPSNNRRPMLVARK